LATFSTVKKVIDAANFTATVPRYGQMVKEPNKLKKVQFAREVITNNDKFNNVIFTDECSVQLHDKMPEHQQKVANLKLVPLSERRRCISVDVLVGFSINAVLRNWISWSVISWGTVKNVIKRYQYGKIRYDHYIQKDQNLPTFQYITDHDIQFLKTALIEKPTRTSTDIQRLFVQSDNFKVVVTSKL
jgi:hypothetical protein